MKYTFVLFIFIFFFIVAGASFAWRYSNNKRIERIIKGYRDVVFSRFPLLPDSSESSERLAVLEHISPRDYVLEIGANIGGVSSLLINILENPSQLVSIEPLAANCEYLQELGRTTNKVFNVFHGVVKGPYLINCSGPNVPGSYVNCSISEEPQTVNLTLTEIQSKYNIIFSAAVIDCEGCYASIMQQILNLESIKQIQIEWDGEFMEKDILNSGFSLIANYTHMFIQRGVSVYKRP
jgi:hypothetical protein